MGFAASPLFRQAREGRDGADANFLASALPRTSQAHFTGASLCSFAFSCCCETHQEPGQPMMFSLTKARLLLRKEVLLLSFPLPATTMALLLLSNGTHKGFEPLAAMWCPAEGTPGRNREGSPSVPSVRRWHPHCSRAHDCLETG